MTEHLGDDLSGLVDGQLDEAATGRAHAHLAGCAVCTADLAATKVVRMMIMSLPLVEPLRPLAAIAPEPARRPGRLAGVLAAAAAAVAVLVMSGVQPTDGTGPQVAELVQVHTTSPVNTDLVSQVAPAALPVSFPR